MAGRLTVSTLNNDTGVLATQNGMTGIAKAWCNFNGSSGASPVIRNSFNISSVTRNGTGDYAVNFTTAMPNVDYSVVVSSGIPTNGFANGPIQLFANNVGGSLTNVTPTTSSFNLSTLSFGGSFTDMPRLSVAVFSS